MEQVSAFRVIFSLVLVLFVIGLLEYYAFKGVYVTLGNGRTSARNVKWIYWSITGIQWGMLVLMMFQFRTLREDNPQLLMGLFAAFIVIAAPKLVMSIFHLVDDVRLLITKGYFKFKPSGEGAGEVISRATFITRTGQFLGLAAFGGFLYGVTKGRFNYRVIAHELKSAVLPKSFDGLKIVQISDAHLGSFAEQFDDVKKGIDMINSLDADYVFFTGDMVNNLAEEAEPWIPYFKEIKAKKGKYSIFGNHDYGDYGPLTDEQKKATQDRLVAIQEEMGFEMLMNRSVQLERNGEVIDLIGVENWGNHFRKSGDLAKALEGTDENRFQILLSHDPTHWEQQVHEKTKIDLTLSGHTHGMQMGVEVPALGIKWSPAAFQYKRWGGMYKEAEQYLHVNRGFGFLGFPGRVGMWPEITLIELKNA